MGKIISFFIIAVLAGIIIWLVKGMVKPKSFYEQEKRTEEQEFKAVVDALKLKILQCKSQAMEGRAGAEDALKKYTKELEEIEEFNSKLNK